VELGYSFMEPFQRRGNATEAVEVVTQWAFSHAEVRIVCAESPP